MTPSSISGRTHPGVSASADPSPAEIRAVLQDVARQYPPHLIQHQLRDVPRATFHISLVLKAVGSRASVVDVGGGAGLFSLGCAALGLDATLLDDLGDQPPYYDDRIAGPFAALCARYGVRIVQADVVQDQPDFAPGTFDAVTSFHSMEHWHHSPKAFFRRMCDSLRPGGLFLLCGPNCVNIRKRLTVPLGRSNWSRMEDWYEQEIFRGHVREPVVGDLRYIARDLGLRNIEVFGRNWLGRKSRWSPVRRMAPLVDPVLQMFPSLCSDIYVSGLRP